MSIENALLYINYALSKHQRHFITYAECNQYRHILRKYIDKSPNNNYDLQAQCCKNLHAIGVIIYKFMPPTYNVVRQPYDMYKQLLWKDFSEGLYYWKSTEYKNSKHIQKYTKLPNVIHNIIISYHEITYKKFETLCSKYAVFLYEVKEVKDLKRYDIVLCRDGCIRVNLILTAKLWYKLPYPKRYILYAIGYIKKRELRGHAIEELCIQMSSKIKEMNLF